MIAIQKYKPNKLHRTGRYFTYKKTGVCKSMTKWKQIFHFHGARLDDIIKGLSLHPAGFHHSLNSSQSLRTWAAKKNTLTFDCTGWFIGIMDPDNGLLNTPGVLFSLITYLSDLNEPTVFHISSGFHFRIFRCSCGLPVTGVLANHSA